MTFVAVYVDIEAMTSTTDEETLHEADALGRAFGQVRSPAGFRDLGIFGWE